MKGQTKAKPMRRVDRRTVMARRYADISREMILDLGGEARMSEAKKLLVANFAGSAVLTEMMLLNVLNGHPVDITEYSSLTANMIRISSRVGVRRRPPVMRIDKPNAKEPLTIVNDASARGGSPS
jgi:hypothetical protein